MKNIAIRDKATVIISMKDNNNNKDVLVNTPHKNVKYSHKKKKYYPTFTARNQTIILNGYKRGCIDYNEAVQATDAFFDMLKNEISETKPPRRKKIITKPPKTKVKKKEPIKKKRTNTRKPKRNNGTNKNKGPK